ncbi:metalloprotease TldD [Paraburkholderia kururiensis]|uniref:metalloprotease TldD n=1 Tax=Paraburkholderia kururiensis TaxID=984307 RepID=UPI0005A9D9A8|nr:metalloprotease TldD [Paraburkholderia kururiensis]
MDDTLKFGARLPSRGETSHAARRCLLERNGVDEVQLASALSMAMGTGADFADLYLADTMTETWSLEGGAVRGGSYRHDSGFGLRVMKSEETTFASSQRIDAAALMRVASQLRTNEASAPPNAARAGDCGSSLDGSSLYIASAPFALVDASERIALLQHVDRVARDHNARVVEVGALLVAVYENVWVARHDGMNVGDVRPLLSLSVSVRVRSGTRMEHARSGIGGRYSLTEWSDEFVASFVTQLVDAAIVKLDARPAPAGSMSVVVGPGWNGVLLHEAVGHGLEADGIRRGTSAFAGRLGQTVAQRGVTIVDDGSMVGRRGSLNVDDEGCRTQRTVLIEDGVLRGFMQDSLSARLMGVAQTGNGRRESYAGLPMPRMTNTFMLNGNHEPDEIVASVKKGIYVAGLEGGQVDIASGQFVFEASEAFLIENGKITAPIKGATITGNGPETIRKISLIGNDLELDSGKATCGKAGQSVPVGVGQPTLRVDGMTVGGTA